ncbi:anti-sigma factor [Cupriavidus plantarum]|uniref:anti-sigma factor n=1 Tax=Cupriavidus plantarum TaxID=942865 RepID=UPI000E24A48C|nr:anti-sigma factor [Cupriavidus plantarum]NYH98211.1 anti-sigma-K factor RskA [Cupriavidus plantarum]REE91810.1 anti-sigma-K factor RskA [Cupriavidus plantarum]
MSAGTPNSDADDRGGDDRGDDVDRLAGEYVLGTLSDASRQGVARRMATDAHLAARVQAWEARLHPMTALVEPVQPDAATWPRIAESVAADVAERVSETGERIGATGIADRGQRVPPPVRADRGRPRWWEALSVWRGMALGASACAVVLAVLLGRQLLQPPPAPRYVVVLAEPRDKTPGWLIQASTARNITLIPLGAQAAPPDRALQFWTKADDWTGPVSLGLVQPGQRVEIPFDKLPALQPNQLFEITLEPATGSPIGKPTGPILYIGRALKVS